MNIYSTPGAKVVYTGTSGYGAEHEDAVCAGLKIGEIYEVEHCEISAYSTDVTLKGIDGIFNSVIFEDFKDAAEDLPPMPKADGFIEIARGCTECVYLPETVQAYARIAIKEALAQTTQQLTLDKEKAHSIIRAGGGIIHRDGNIFFTDFTQFMRAAVAAPGAGTQDQIDAARWRRLVNASEMEFPVLAIANDPENDKLLIYGRKFLEQLVDMAD